MVLFGFSNILIKTFIESSYSKEQITNMSLIILTTIIRIHIDSLLTYFILLFDFNEIFCIISSICLYFMSNHIYNLIVRYRPQIYEIVKYTINTYDYNKYKKWKRYTTICICLYIYLLSLVINITSSLIRNSIFEYIVCFFIIDLIENKYYKKIFIKGNNHLYIYDDSFFLKEKKKTNNDLKQQTMSEVKQSDDTKEHGDETKEQKIIYNNDFELKKE